MKKASNNVDLAFLSPHLPEFVLRAEIEKHLAPHFGRVFTKRSMEFFDQTGQGPARVRVGRSIAYRKADLLSWLETRVLSLN